jgi:hypothetical protein
MYDYPKLGDIYKGNFGVGLAFSNGEGSLTKANGNIHSGEWNSFKLNGAYYWNLE